MCAPEQGVPPQGGLENWPWGLSPGAAGDDDPLTLTLAPRWTLHLVRIANTRVNIALTAFDLSSSSQQVTSFRLKTCEPALPAAPCALAQWFWNAHRGLSANFK